LKGFPTPRLLNFWEFRNFRLDIDPGNALKGPSRSSPNFGPGFFCDDYSKVLHDRPQTAFMMICVYRGIRPPSSGSPGGFPPRGLAFAEGPATSVIWCSTTYLGMGQHPKVVGAMSRPRTRVRTGRPSATRNIAGTHHPLVQRSSRHLPILHGQAMPLFVSFTSGYGPLEHSGIATIGKLVSPLPESSLTALNHNFDDPKASPPFRLSSARFSLTQMAHRRRTARAAGPDRATTESPCESLIRWTGGGYRAAFRKSAISPSVWAPYLCPTKGVTRCECMVRAAAQ